MTYLVVIYGLLSGCFLSVLVGLIGRRRRIGFGWAFLISVFFTPFVGLLCALISNPLPDNQQQNWGCVGTIVGGLGCLFLVLLLLAIFTSGTIAMFA